MRDWRLSNILSHSSRILCFSFILFKKRYYPLAYAFRCQGVLKTTWHQFEKYSKILLHLLNPQESVSTPKVTYYLISKTQ